jgi:hypothetical protein
VRLHGDAAADRGAADLAAHVTADTDDGVRHLRQRALLLGWRFRDTPFAGAGELVAGVGGTLGSAGSETVREATAERSWARVDAVRPHVFPVPRRADDWRHTFGSVPSLA